jgi:hypothetical protein
MKLFCGPEKSGASRQPALFVPVPICPPGTADTRKDQPQNLMGFSRASSLTRIGPASALQKCMLQVRNTGWPFLIAKYLFLNGIGGSLQNEVSIQTCLSLTTLLNY